MPVSPLKPIKHAELRGGLQSVARPLETDGRDWTGGISFNEACDIIGGGVSCEDPAVEKTLTELGDPVEFNPFLLYNLERCAGIGRFDGLQALSNEHLRRTENRNLAIQLHDASFSPAGDLDPSLQSSATDVTGGGGAVGIKETLCGLVQAICEFHIGEIVFHAPLKVMPSMLFDNLVLWNATANRYEFGHYSVSFDCYPNVGPDSTGNIVPADNEAYIYVSGPVEFAKGTIQSVQNFDQHINEHLAREERLAILRFDPCTVIAANAEIC